MHQRHHLTAAEVATLIARSPCVTHVEYCARAMAGSGVLPPLPPSVTSLSVCGLWRAPPQLLNAIALDYGCAHVAAGAWCASLNARV